MLKRLIYILTCLTFMLATPTASAQRAVELSGRIATIEGRRYYVHTVAARETLRAIALAYGVSQDEIISKNPFAAKRLKTGVSLLVPMAGQSDTKSDTKKQEAKNTDNKQTTPLTPLIPIVTKDDSRQMDSLQDEPDFATPNEKAASTVLTKGVTRDFNPRSGINIAMLLPFGSERSAEVNFVEFLQGSLLAANRLKAQGVNLNLDIHSTMGDADKAADLIESGELDRADLIIGPVYDEPFNVIGSWATERRVPIVSPLGGTGALDNAYTVAVAPDNEARYEKLVASLGNPATNVIYITPDKAIDKAMADEIQSLLPQNVRHLNYMGKNETKVTSITDLLSRDMPNLIVMPITNETLTEEILSRLSSINSGAKYEISVVGSSRWARFTNLNLNLFFKLNVSYVTSYYGDCTNEKVAAFTKDYIAAFGAVPSLYAMRGYDVMLYFGRLMDAHGSRMMYELPYFTTDLLQVPYVFNQQNSPSSKFSNREWVVVSYNPNYTITTR